MMLRRRHKPVLATDKRNSGKAIRRKRGEDGEKGWRDRKNIPGLQESESVASYFGTLALV